MHKVPKRAAWEGSPEQRRESAFAGAYRAFAHPESAAMQAALRLSGTP